MRNGDNGDAVYPFDLLVEELVIPRDLSRTPVFEVMVVLQNGSRQTLDLEDVKVSEFPVEWKASKFSLSFEFVENEDGSLALNLEYDCDLFRRDRIERLAGHFLELLKNALAEPSQRVDAINLLPPGEREQLLRQNPVPDLPAGKTVPGVFEEIAAMLPRNLAVICEETELTYAELNERANQLAHALSQRQVGRGDIVGVMLERSEWLVIAFLGILKCGAVYLPLDPSYPAGRVEYMLEDSRCAVVIADPHCRDAVATNQRRQWLDVRSLSGGSSAYPSPALESSDLAYLIYTRVPPANPRACCWSTAACVNLAPPRNGLGISPSHRVLQFAPLFDASV